VNTPAAEDEHPAERVDWTVERMRARVDLEDRDVVQRILDAEQQE
jgi:hypothetical protein